MFPQLYHIHLQHQLKTDVYLTLKILVYLLQFNKGLLSSRDRTLFGVCLYTACRIAEACSLMVKDIYYY